MRRGHSGIGGWRNEIPRHFRPRIGGNPHFRPPRSYGLLDGPRFPPPFNNNSRTVRFTTRSENSDRTPSDHSDRYRYRGNTYQRPHQQGERPSIPPLLQWTRPKGDCNRNTSKEPSNYYDQPADNFHVNSMGDVDHRHIPQTREVFNRPSHLISPWQSDHPLHTPVGKGRHTYGQDRGHANNPSAASIEYTGHRPPSSDHYGCNPTSVIDSSDTFSRSVDDTVDIVRKKLQNRNDPQLATDNFEDCQDKTPSDGQNLETRDNFQNYENEQPIRKRYQRQRVTDKSNCAKIKNKIVHQLFKMDKEKIHKLMDNPNSSTKFEYAINSLITESQNSFNRHLRSAAEKSLCGSSTEFIGNGNNTIYEDTFLKQMQCMLDPQDTVFLEDIKPFVMAEIIKVLQLNEYEQNYNVGEDSFATDSHDEHQNYYPYPNNSFRHDDVSTEDNYSMEHNISEADYQRSKSVEPTIHNYGGEDKMSHYSDPKPLFERRQRTKSFSYMQDSKVFETPFYGREMEEKSNKDINRSDTPRDLFDSNAEHFSEDEDPFAELDKQYHVAVDHDFIKRDDVSSPKQEPDQYNNDYMNTFKSEPLSPERNLKNTNKDMETQLHDMTKSPSKLSLPISMSVKEETKDTLLPCKQEPLSSAKPLQEKNENNISHDNENTSNKSESESKEIIKEIDKTDLSSNLKSTSSNSRKRSIDQRPSHRKEKRKKSESCASEQSKQILNKNIIINVNDCASKTIDKCETSKSIFNLFFSKEDNKTVSSNDKNCTEKHAKRKETPKKSEKDRTKRKDSTSSVHLTSPSENNNTNIMIGDTPIKSETKIILKPIDMFNELPKKSNVHQAHRNTAVPPTPSSTPKIEVIKNTKLKGPLCKQLLKRHVAVQVIRKVHAKHTQTPPSKCGTQSCQAKKKCVTRSVQTDVDVPDRTGNKSCDAFERMKEIDLEIQVLIQEKFKLYSSIENNQTGTSSNIGQTLGMTVLNVSPYDGEAENEAPDNIISEDAIVNDFANIPVEELEQIAMETVQEHEGETSKKFKRSRRSKVQEKSHSQSPVTVQKRKKTKAKSPNISLIEQIITDDRPLEDIISLDDLEMPQVKTKSKKKKTTTSKKKGTSKSKVVKPSNTIDYMLKECCVIVERLDITPYIKPIKSKTPGPVVGSIVIEDDITDINQKGIVLDTNTDTNLNMVYEQDVNIVEESIDNGIQFDMLDVSEDIVVGDSCEVKSLEDKEAVIEVTAPICEEIILDNSQSSVEDATTPPVGRAGECKMYDYSADENLRRDSVVVNGNADAVLALECVENNFLAACLDGNVYYFNNDGHLLTTLRGSNLAVTCLTIVKEKYGTTVYTGSLDSRIRYYDLETGLEKGPECNVLSPIQTMDRAWDTVFVGTRTGFVLQFECKNNMLIPVSSVKFSDQSILALRAMKEGPRKVLLVAARSENVTIKDAQTGLLLRTLVGPKMTVYSLLYEDGKVYCGTSSHQIHVFDYASGSHFGTHSGGKGAVCLRATGGLLFAGCYDGCVYVYREGESQPFAQIRGPSLMLLSLAVVGSKIIAGYKDRSLYIWKIPLSILQEMIL
ncbi:putative autophagy-related protein 11 [Maniola hyperantus]|uniref:putative autophagy-related protein 11 n=1 Tax=Aphantopus hyperantus TaxID=2795564 RepID=UPI0015695474|nr:uncharacterized protein LOC117990603 [Maniola hyperantus]